MQISYASLIVIVRILFCSCLLPFLSQIVSTSCFPGINNETSPRQKSFTLLIVSWESPACTLTFSFSTIVIDSAKVPTTYWHFDRLFGRAHFDLFIAFPKPWQDMIFVDFGDSNGAWLFGSHYLFSCLLSITSGITSLCFAGNSVLLCFLLYAFTQSNSFFRYSSRFFFFLSLSPFFLSLGISLGHILKEENNGVKCFTWINACTCIVKNWNNTFAVT